MMRRCGWTVRRTDWQDLAFEKIESADVVNHIVHLVGHGKDVFQIFATELLDRDDILAVPGGVFVVAKGQVGHVMAGGHIFLLDIFNGLRIV
jgi:ApbE superfamily uncharacterized protein (UPF0280 family)